MVRRPLLACPSDYDGPLRLVGRFLRKAAAPPRACAARLHMRAADLMCAVCRCNRTWLLLHHVCGIAKLCSSGGLRCAAALAR